MPCVPSKGRNPGATDFNLDEENTAESPSEFLRQTFLGLCQWCTKLLVSIILTETILWGKKSAILLEFYFADIQTEWKNIFLVLIQPKLPHFTWIKNKKELQISLLIFIVHKIHFFEGKIQGITVSNCLIFSPGQHHVIEKNLFLSSPFNTVTSLANLHVAHVFLPFLSPMQLHNFTPHPESVCVGGHGDTAEHWGYLILHSGTNSLLLLLQPTKMCDICSILAI